MAKTIGSRAVATGRGGADVTSGTSDAMVSQREDLSNFIKRTNTSATSQQSQMKSYPDS